MSHTRWYSCLKSILIAAVLTTLLLCKVLGTDLSISSEDNETGEEDIATRDELHDINQNELPPVNTNRPNHIPEEFEDIAELYDDLISGETTTEEVESSERLQSLQSKLQDEIMNMESKYCTPKLWIKYVEMINRISYDQNEQVNSYST